MREDVTKQHAANVREWALKPYKKLSGKAMELLNALADGSEVERPDMFRDAGYEANKNSYADLSDYRLYKNGLINMRVTGCLAVNGRDWTGTKTFWTINRHGLEALRSGTL